MAKGIRVNQLAKELGVESKTILAKCRDEGVGDRVPNHMSVLSLGLAETVREWFHSGHGGVATAVETAAPVDAEVAAKTKARTRKKKVEVAAEVVAQPDEQQAEAPSQPVPVAEAEVPVAPAPAEVEEAAAQAKTHRAKHAELKHEEPALPAPTPGPSLSPEPAPVPEAPPAPVAEAAVVPAVVAMEAPAVVPPAPVAAPAMEAAPAPAEVAAPVAVAEAPVVAEAPPAPHVGKGKGAPHRPTVKAATPSAPPAVVRAPVIPAPRLGVPAPAKIQGPRVVRVEKEEVVDARGPRGPRGPRFGQAGDGPLVVPAGPRGGRGVKIAEEDDEAEKKKKAGLKGGNRTLSSRRRGPDGRRGEAMEKLKEYTEADLIERRDRLAAATGYRTGLDRDLKKRTERGQHGPAKTILQKGQPVEMEEPITIKTLSAALGIKSSDMISKLMKQGKFVTINQPLEQAAAESLATQYGIELLVRQQPTLEEALQREFDEREPAEGALAPRPPVVTILGHVDHGKTSLLDKIRNANVAAGEAGGITQHTAAWMVQLGEKRVTFIDTPGHQAFTAMRARGANMTDVVVLVVSAAEGVQPQTIESMNHARAAGVPIVVALNKIDRPDANEQAVLGQLAAQGLNPVEWGGDTEVVRTSATTGQGIEDLIAILDYQSELLELKADPTAPARGVVIESRVDEGMGSVATVLVQDGTLHVGDIILSGPGYGRIRILKDDRGHSIQEAGPATPVIVGGLDLLPNAGDKFFVMEDQDRARSIAEERQNRSRQETLAVKSQVTLDSILASMKAAEVKEIRLIIKADVQGSVETLTKTVTEANTDEVKVHVIHTSVGAINESDVELADASKAVIIGFHVVPDDAARAMAEQRRVEIRLYRVIYEILDDLKKALSGLLEPEVREKLHGHVEVRQVYKVSRVGNVAGCMVTDGHIQRGSRIRLIRNGVVITEELSLESLRRVKDDVREVKQGFECGIKLAGYDDIKVGDVFEAYIRESFQRTL